MRYAAIITAVIGLLAVFAGGEAVAGTIDLMEYAVNDDGTVYSPLFGDTLPTSVDDSLFDDLTGLGTITATYNTVGTHYAALFVDHEIDETTNTFFNEYGTQSGTAAAGQTWEIDEPGYAFGDIYDNFELYMALDGTNGVPVGLEEDVSMALAWDFSLLTGETATVSWDLSTTAPTSGFYLSHTDPDSATPTSIYFTSTLSIKGSGPGPVVPLPPAFALALPGFALAAAYRRRRRMSAK